MENIEINFTDTGLTYHSNKNDFTEGKENVVRWLKGRYRTKGRLMNEFIPNFTYGEITESIEDYIFNEFDGAEPFTYTEAFKIESPTLRALVFDTIDVAKMVEELGSELIASDGKEVVRKQFSRSGERLADKVYHNIYHTHKVFIGELLGNDDDFDGADEVAYALQCWCTSTNKEHWIWIEEQYKDKPLEAVASTFRVHSDVIPFIKEIKRQGDILVAELTKEIDEPTGEIVPLTAEQYFGLLTAES